MRSSYTSEQQAFNSPPSIIIIFTSFYCPHLSHAPTFPKMDPPPFSPRPWGAGVLGPGGGGPLHNLPVDWTLPHHPINVPSQVGRPSLGGRLNISPKVITPDISGPNEDTFCASGAVTALSLHWKTNLSFLTFRVLGLWLYPKIQVKANKQTVSPPNCQTAELKTAAMYKVSFNFLSFLCITFYACDILAATRDAAKRNFFAFFYDDSKASSSSSGNLMEEVFYV